MAIRKILNGDEIEKDPLTGIHWCGWIEVTCPNGEIAWLTPSGVDAIESLGVEEFKKRLGESAKEFIFEPSRGILA